VTKKLEPPSRFLLTRYPVSSANPDKKTLNRWDVPIKPFEDDSCVVMYWKEQNLKPGETREVGFSYGVGNVAITGNKLGVTVGGAMETGGELTVVALIADPAAKAATLDVKDGLTLVDPSSRTQKVPPTRADENGQVRPVPLTWRVRASSPGRHDLSVSTDSGLTQSRKVTIQTKALFN